MRELVTALPRLAVPGQQPLHGARRAEVARRDALDAAICAEAATEPWAGVVGRLSCLRGVSTLTAFALATEIGEWRRFDGCSLGAYLGLTPSESSPGERRHQGAITKTGNAHARRLPVEAAWHHRRRPGSAVSWRVAVKGSRRRGPRTRRLVVEPRRDGRLSLTPGTPRRVRPARPRVEHARSGYEQPDGPRSILGWHADIWGEDCILLGLENDDVYPLLAARAAVGHRRTVELAAQPPWHPREHYHSGAPD